MGMQKQVMVLHKTISYSAVDTVLVHLEKHTTAGNTSIPLIKNNELHFGLTPVLLKLGRC